VLHKASGKVSHIREFRAFRGEGPEAASVQITRLARQTKVR